MSQKLGPNTNEAGDKLLLQKCLFTRYEEVLNSTLASCKNETSIKWTPGSQIYRSKCQSNVCQYFDGQKPQNLKNPSRELAHLPLD